MNLFYDDIIYSLQQNGGITTYWKNITENAEIMDTFCVSRNNCVTSNSGILLRQLLKLEKVALPKNFDGIFHSSYYRLPNVSCRTVVTVHDFIYEYFSSGMTRKLNTFHISRAIRKADAIICVSDATRLDLMKFIPGINEDKINIVHHGVDHSIFNRDLELNKRNIKDMALFVGARQGYKNFVTAVLAIANLKCARLGIIGPPLNSQERVILVKNKVNFVEYGRVSTPKLASLYRNAGCLIYPSLYEGFGIPILEAMATGLPVVISDNAASKEVASGHAFIGSGQDVNSYISAVDRAFNMSAELRDLAAAHAKKFTWTAAAAALANVYRSLEN
ncbi:glycosyltransferase family 4 protein [Planktomarina temperata]|nr:glycosyltransferase family 4 protein [Planktomarina temperata]MDB2460768.1 glycosyltransferase family 4 protein [Planktomarina temperata]